MLVSGWRWLTAVLLVVGIFLLPLRAAATTVPMLIAYEAAGVLTATTRIEAGGSVRPERGVIPEYVYDDATDGHDGRTKRRAADTIGAVQSYDGTFNLANWREAREGAIFDAPATTIAAEGVGAAPRILYHYTDAAETSFARGLWSGTSVTDTAELSATEAVEKLGLKSVPDKIIPVIDNGNFVPNRPFIVQPHPLGPGGGTDFFNLRLVPPGNILPAILIGGGG